MRTILAFILIFIFFNCSNKMTAKYSDGTYYFRSWSGYDIPFKPVKPISYEEAIALDTYYVGQYENGNLVCFEKNYKQVKEWTDEYSYHSNGKLKSRKMTKVDGSIIYQEYDAKGNVLK